MKKDDVLFLWCNLISSQKVGFLDLNLKICPRNNFWGEWAFIGWLDVSLLKGHQKIAIFHHQHQVSAGSLVEVQEMNNVEIQGGWWAP